MKPKTAKQINVLLRFTFGLGLALCISSICIQATAADEPAQAAEAAKEGGTAQKEKGKLSLTKVAPELTPVSDYTGDIWHRSTLLGDLGGKRQDLYENYGIMFDGSLTQVFQGVASGGSDSGDTAYTGLLDYSLSLDTGKLNLWPGGLFVFHFQTGFASGLPLEEGTVSPSNFTSIYPTTDKPDTQLMEYYWTQAFSKDFVLIGGRLNAVNFLDRNRFANDPRNQFMNISLNNDPLFGAFISFSTVGALASWKITENFSINPAVFDPNLQPGDNNLDDLFSDVGVAAEADLTWKLGADLGGAFRAAGIYVNKETTGFDNTRLLPFTDIRIGGIEDIIISVPELDTKPDNWIVSLNAEQYLWKPSSSTRSKSRVRTRSFDFQEPGIGLFGRYSYTPEDRNAWNMYASGGIAGRGIIPGRPYDRVGLGIYWLKESNDLDDLPGNLLQDELGFEAFYNLAVTPWAQLSFDLQWIDPGVTDTDNTVVLGTRLFTAF